MNEDRVSKWIAIATNAAVLIGVILLIVEIRQNNDLARIEAIQERRYIQQQGEMAFFDRDVSEIWELENDGLMNRGDTRVYMKDDFRFLFSNRFGKVWWHQVGAPGWPHLAEDGNEIIAGLDNNGTENDFLVIQNALREEE